MKLIYVERADIEAGRRGDFQFCPIALAARRAGYIDAEVFPDWMSYTVLDDNGGHRVRAWLPVEASEFVEAFDMGDPDDMVPPFSFEPEPYQS